MDPLAATPSIPAIPQEWITSGIITPVDGTTAVIPSVGAAIPTGYVPEPVYAAAPAPAQAQAALSSLTLVDLAAEMRRQAALQPHVAANAVVAATPPPTDPTLTKSVGGALAGFASATGRVITGVAGSGISGARKVGSEIWAGVRSPRTVHVSQVPSKYNEAPAAGNRDCGPASVVMTLKLLGKNIPGVADNSAPQKLINGVRKLAGNVSNRVSTTNHDLERALEAAGTKTREISDAKSIRDAVEAGKPVILNGNPGASGAYGSRFSADEMTKYDGAHWILVSGFDEQAGKYIINDPLSKVGPVKVSPSELEGYRGGSMGIEVTR